MTSYTFAIVCLAIGAALVFFGLPVGGETRPWTRGALMEMLYPVICLLFLVMGIAFLFSGSA
jgi:hypothetical protein